MCLHGGLVVVVPSERLEVVIVPDTWRRVVVRGERTGNKLRKAPSEWVVSGVGMPRLTKGCE